MKDICINISKVLERYLDGELSPRKVAKVEAHLKECRLCQGRLAELTEVGSLVRASLEEHASDERVQGLWRRVEASLGDSGKKPGWLPWRWVFSLKPALAMVLVIVAVAGFFTWSRMGSEKAPFSSKVTILSLENSGPGVMVFQSAEADLTVIWILS